MSKGGKYDWEYIALLLEIATKLVNFPKYRPLMDAANVELDAIANPPVEEEEKEDLISRDVTESGPGEPPPPDQSHLEDPPPEPAPLPVQRTNPPTEVLPGQPDPRQEPRRVQTARDDSPMGRAMMPPDRRA